MMWKTEKDFGKSLMAKFKKEGMDCMRIETAGTITGCPDLFIQGKGTDAFIELKRVHVELPAMCDYRVSSLAVPWRPGQQAWAQRYKQCHLNKVSWTFVDCDDGIAIIPMDKYFVHDVVMFSDNCLFWVTEKEYRTLSLTKIMHDIGGVV